jgi:hypothetical protein
LRLDCFQCATGRWCQLRAQNLLKLAAPSPGFNPPERNKICSGDFLLTGKKDFEKVDHDS